MRGTKNERRNDFGRILNMTMFADCREKYTKDAYPFGTYARKNVLQQMSRSHRVVARDGSVRMSKVKRLGE